MEQELKYVQNNTWKSVFLDYSTIVLVGSNLLTIFLAVTQHWSLGTIIWTYWAQSIIIGIFNTTRIFTLDKFSTEGFTSNGKPVEPNSRKSKIDTGVFFLFHYGFFHFGYAIFLWINFKDISFKYLLVGAIIFFFNHLFSYIHNHYEDKNGMPNLGRMMFSPYVRIIPMHLTIVFLGSHIKSISALIMFLTLKSVLDVLMHLLEHKQKLSNINKTSSNSIN